MRRTSLQWGIPQLDMKIAVIVLDSVPKAEEFVMQCAAMLVPRGRESDWIFASKAGQLQLLASCGVARLILLARGIQCSSDAEEEGIREAPHQEWEISSDDGGGDELLKQHLVPRLVALAGDEVPFVTYEDNVVWRRVVAKAFSASIGLMIVEDVRLESKAIRRRLRFKSMPNLLQTEVSIAEEDWKVDHDVLVHVYLAPLVAGLCLISQSLAEACGRIFCIGIGGGALPMFLSRRFKAFQVVAVDIDEVVVEVAKRNFGLSETNNLQLRVEDGLRAVEKISAEVQQHGFDEAQRLQAIFVDVSAGDGLTCPPQVFLDTKFLVEARSALDSGGMLAMNVMTGGDNDSHRAIIRTLAAVFDEVYEIEVDGGENFAVFALPNPCDQSDAAHPIISEVEVFVGAELVNSIRRVA